MNSKILFVSRNDQRGGAFYEAEAKKILQEICEVDSLNLESKKNNWLLFTKLKYTFQVKTFSSEKKYDILIANRAAVYAGISTSGYRKKILVIHHYNSKENSYPIFRFLLRKKFFTKLDRFDVVVVVSNFWKDFLSNYISSRKIKVIHNSFDVEFIEKVRRDFNKSAFQQKYNLPEDKTIVYAGSALKIKGYKEVISLLDPSKYFVVTSGSKEGNIQHKHLDLSYEEYIKLLCATDITIILSRLEEGWNRIAHESLLCGTRVIGTDIGGLGELLRNAHQVIFNPENRLDSLIDAALSDSSMIIKGQQYAQLFDMNYFTREWQSLVTE